MIRMASLDLFALEALTSRRHPFKLRSRGKYENLVFDILLHNKLLLGRFEARCYCTLRRKV